MKSEGTALPVSAQPQELEGGWATANLGDVAVSSDQGRLGLHRLLLSRGLHADIRAALL